MIANETHNEEAVLLFAFAGNGRGRKSDWKDTGIL